MNPHLVQFLIIVAAIVAAEFILCWFGKRGPASG